MSGMSLVIGLVIVSSVALGGTQINQRQIDLVKSGKIKVARASWWGFNAEDCTESLQAAIDSGARTVVVENMGRPWIVRPIRLASNQKIIFELGTEVLAKRGEFEGKTDSLFRADNAENISLIGYGATLRMWRSDYDSPEYEKAEWRHALSIRSCSNVKIYGLRLAESGGDGIYLGTATRGVTNSNVHIKDVVCDRNYRQGISVITADNLVIENTVMQYTAGTAPQAGIDFEPNRPEERLTNIVMRNCVTRENAGDGYEFWLRLLNAKSEPVSIRLENCRSIGDGSCSTRVATGNKPDEAVGGRIEFVDCVFQGGGKAGVGIWNKPASGCRVRFERCSILDAAVESPDLAPILFTNSKDATEAMGGIDFGEIVIRDPINRAPIQHRDASGSTPIQDISGVMKIEKPEGSRRIMITPEEVERAGQ